MFVLYIDLLPQMRMMDDQSVAKKVDTSTIPSPLGRVAFVSGKLCPQASFVKVAAPLPIPPVVRGPVKTLRVPNMLPVSCFFACSCLLLAEEVSVELMVAWCVTLENPYVK